MEKVTRLFLEKFAHIILKIAKNVYTCPQERRVVKWFKKNGDKTLRLNYSLNEKSVVFDLGGYEGQWTSDIFSKYCCYIHIFEPVGKFNTQIKERFSKNKKITVHAYGLSNDTKTVLISVNDDCSSIFTLGEKTEKIRLVKAIDFMQKRNIGTIDLMKINIEGGEYDLLDHLIKTGFATHIKNIQVQFHDFIPNAFERMQRIQKNLSKTHFLTYQYIFVWENWQIK